MNDDTDNCHALRTDEGPNIRHLVDELNTAIEHAATAIDNMAKAENTRFAYWEDQQPDGRKPDLEDGAPAKPWPRSSDVRVRLADEVIQQDLRLMKKVVRSGRLVVKGTEGGDFAAAGKAQIYIDHLRNVRLRANVRRSTALAANWRQTYGYAALAVTWRQKWQRDFDPLTLEDLQAMAQLGQPPVAGQLLALLAEPGGEARRLAVSIVQQMYPDCEKDEAYKQLAVLRAGGQAQFPTRSLAVNRPEWTALKLGRDLFGPANAEDEQESPWWAWRVTLTAAQLEEKQFSEQWSPEFIAAVKETEGTTVLDQIQQKLGAAWRETYRSREEQMKGLHEVFYHYYEASDEDGLPTKFRTVISPHVGKEESLYGVDGPLGYDHGLYPFVILRREFAERSVLETRGVAEIAHTNQLEVKWQRDGQINQTDLALQPPTIRPEREIGLPLAIRPMGEIGERRSQALRFLSTPPVPPSSPQLEAEARRDVMRYFARNRAEDPVAAGLADEDLVDDWASELDQCWTMTLQLAQQFEQPQLYTRLVGGQPVPFKVGRDEIRGQHDLQMQFNPGNLDPEQLKARTEAVAQLLMPMDRSGKIDWAPVVAGLFSHFLPEFADQAIRSGDQADAAEIKDEANNWGLILGGTEPEMVEHGQNFQLRLQWLQNKAQEPGAIARLQQLPDSAALLQRRMEHLQFQVQQGVNAQTGRVGVAPQQQVATA